MKKNMLIILVMFSFSCKEKVGNQKISDNKNITVTKDSIQSTETAYKKFIPDNIPFKIKDFNITNSYKIDSKYLVFGFYGSNDGQITLPNTKEDYGKRLLVLNEKEEVEFKSRGTGDIYIFTPHFFNNKFNNRILIICQLAFEYSCGAEVFLFENGKVKHLGLLDVEINDENKFITDVIDIKENSNQIIFSFNTKSLVLEPGSKDKVIKNNGLKYIYENNQLRLYK